MRDIKFRALIDGRMINWSPGFFSDMSEVTGYGSEFPGDDVALMQYTGLKDKSGVEIYEGDIVESPDSVFIVEWADGGYWKAVKISGGHLGATQLVYGLGFDYLVIGNIHTNPELINPIQKIEQ